MADFFSSCELFFLPPVLRVLGLFSGFCPFNCPELLQDGEREDLFLSLHWLLLQQMSNKRVQVLNNSSQKGIFHPSHDETLQEATGVAFRLMRALSRKKKKKRSKKEHDFSIHFLIIYFFWVLAGTSVLNLCTVLVSLDLFIPSLLGRWGCTLRRGTYHHTLSPQQGGHDRGHSSRMAASISCSTGELGLLPSPRSATHQG